MLADFSRQLSDCSNGYSGGLEKFKSSISGTQDKVDIILTMTNGINPVQEINANVKNYNI